MRPTTTATAASTRVSTATPRTAATTSPTAGPWAFHSKARTQTTRPGPSTGTSAMGDRDWFTIKATEDKSDACITNGQDADVEAQVTLTSPGPGLWYEVCACWSDGPSFCGEDDELSHVRCLKERRHSGARRHLAMTCGSTDTGWLDIEVKPVSNNLDWNCDDYTVTWAISE